MRVCEYHIPCGGKFVAFKTRIGKYHMGCLVPCEYRKCKRSAIGTIQEVAVGRS